METGAEALLRTLAAGGVEVCFANPGCDAAHMWRRAALHAANPNAEADIRAPQHD